ncbi:MAG TPA: mechanosensitive ion channel domain-containing protein [Candidatus Limnocylindria bacterium]|jgi:small-conductance mechanosensitive channel|nr:mechanosensitive ion channel domain-containing protein [Candidatus Limnocylindria bacterium]
MHLLGWLNDTERDILIAVATTAAAALLGVLVHRLLQRFVLAWAQRSGSDLLQAIIRRTSRPAAYIVPLIFILIALPNIVLRDPDMPLRGVIVHSAGLATIAATAWAISALIRLWADIIVARHRIDVEDNLLARQLGTRVDILARTATILVVIVAAATMLMTFPSIRTIGTTLLASAGAAGIVVGLAARPLFENLFAGIQLAMTQPIRLDDVVVVQGYWGRIEEIHSTYVVIQVWDLRRLVVPLAWFINNPFENWTRRTANLLGEVYFFADWTLDVEALRAEVPKILARTKLWDGRVQNCQMTDATAQAIQLRVLVSARNSGDLWDLRCFAREGIIAYLRDHQPHALPQVRFDSPAPNELADRNGQVARTSAADVQKVRTVKVEGGIGS